MQYPFPFSQSLFYAETGGGRGRPDIIPNKRTAWLGSSKARQQPHNSGVGGKSPEGEAHAKSWAKGAAGEQG
jgi:hypothetical protein